MKDTEIDDILYKIQAVAKEAEVPPSAYVKMMDLMHEIVTEAKRRKRRTTHKDVMDYISDLEDELSRERYPDTMGS